MEENILQYHIIKAELEPLCCMILFHPKTIFEQEIKSLNNVCSYFLFIL